MDPLITFPRDGSLPAVSVLKPPQAKQHVRAGMSGFSEPLFSRSAW